MSDYRQKPYDRGPSVLEFFLGVLLGGFLGAVMGVLMAPRAGTETRQQLAEGLNTLQDRMGKILQEARTNSQDLLKKS